MRKTERLFIVMTSLSAALLLLIMAENVLVSLQSRHAGTGTGTAVPEIEERSPLDPARTEALRKKFEDLGLPLHEGKHWKGTQ